MFLTLEDPRAKVQGSRDPLGVQPVWTHFGREIVTNLTTVSRAVRGFGVLLLGRYFGQQLIEAGGVPEEEAIPIFLRTEQLAAYARNSASTGEDDDLVLGITRVKRFLNEYGGKVPIRNDATGFILSDQKTYGLWGLYSVAARVSGLLEDGPVGLTPWARDFVEQEYIERLKSVARRLRKLIAEGGELDTKRGKEPFTTLARVFTGRLSDGERLFYGEALRDAVKVDRTGPAGRQRQLAELLQSHTDPQKSVTRAAVVTLSGAAEQRGQDALASRLQRILRLEAVLAPAESLFELLQARNGQTPASVAAHLTDHWGSRLPNLSSPVEPLLHEVRLCVSDEQTTQIQACNHALANGQYEESINAVLKWNEIVMAARGSAPWIKLNGDTLDVRYRSREGKLPAGDELADLWRNTYFIDALKDVTFELTEDANAGS